MDSLVEHFHSTRLVFCIKVFSDKQIKLSITHSSKTCPSYSTQIVLSTFPKWIGYRVVTSKIKYIGYATHQLSSPITASRSSPQVFTILFHPWDECVNTFANSDGKENPRLMFCITCEKTSLKETSALLAQKKNSFLNSRTATKGLVTGSTPGRGVHAKLADL